MPSKKKKYNARFPPARIKKIMQSDEEVGKVAQVVPIIISKSLEIFVEQLLSASAEVTRHRNARTLTPTHIKASILSKPEFAFLREVAQSIPDVSSAVDEGVDTDGGGDPSTPMDFSVRSNSTTSSSRPAVVQRQVSTPGAVPAVLNLSNNSQHHQMITPAPPMGAYQPAVTAAGQQQQQPLVPYQPRARGRPRKRPLPEDPLCQQPGVSSSYGTPGRKPGRVAAPIYQPPAAMVTTASSSFVGLTTPPPMIATVTAPPPISSSSLEALASVMQKSRPTVTPTVAPPPPSSHCRSPRKRTSSNHSDDSATDNGNDDEDDEDDEDEEETEEEDEDDESDRAVASLGGGPARPSVLVPNPIASSLPPAPPPSSTITTSNEDDDYDNF